MRERLTEVLSKIEFEFMRLMSCLWIRSCVIVIFVTSMLLMRIRVASGLRSRLITPNMSPLRGFSGHGIQGGGGDTGEIPMQSSELYQDLRLWRKSRSEEMQKQVYHIMTNRVLEAIVLDRPTSAMDLYKIKGVGPKTMEHAERILDMVNQHRDEPPVVQPAPKSKTAASSSSSSSSSSSVRTRRKSKPVPFVPYTDADTATDASSSSVLPSPGQYHSFGGPPATYASLTDEQRRAAERVLRGDSVFITGSAGTGKSHVLKYIIQTLQSAHAVGEVGITAPTGVAAVNVGGQTVHSFAGIGLGKGRRETLIQKVLRSKKAVERWSEVKVLIIDEVSMLDKNLFDTLDVVARRVRGVLDKPFGGIQLVAVGDFFQLPPVVGGADKSFCFQAAAWKQMALDQEPNKIFLHQVVRQRDAGFIDILNNVRVGRVTDETVRVLEQHLVTRKPLPTDGIVPTRLYCHNRDVDQMNQDRLNALEGELVKFEARDYLRIEPEGGRATAMKYMKDNVDKTVPEVISLKVGAQVMLLRNRAALSGSSSTTLVNGSRGIVVRFIESSDGDGSRIPVVRFDNGQTVPVAPVETLQGGPSGDGMLARSQLPLKLAWAVTVHKSQGSTLTRAILEIASAFDYGQAYVALSRVSSLDGLWLSRPIRKDAIKVHEDVLKFYGFTDDGAEEERDGSTGTAGTTAEILSKARPIALSGEPKAFAYGAFDSDYIDYDMGSDDEDAMYGC